MPSSPSPPKPRVLVVGPRPGLTAALKRKRIPYAVWAESDRVVGGKRPVLVAPFRQSESKLRVEAERLVEHGPFTHVIGATEASVVAASVARRVLDARRSEHTVALRCHDKLYMKRKIFDAGVRLTDFLDGNVDLSGQEVLDRLGSPVVVKDRSSSGGRGLTLAATPDDLEGAQRRDRLLERYVDAEEASIETFLDDGEILFTNITRYVTKREVNALPAPPDEHTAALLQLNQRALRALRVRWGMTHLEVYLTPDGPLFGEVALRPPGGYIMDLLELAWGFDPWEALIAVELGRPFSFPVQAEAAAAAWVLHPGGGRLRAIEGVDQVLAHPACADLKLKVAPGDVIAERTGVGVDVGRLLLRAPTWAKLQKALGEARRTLVFDVEPGPPSVPADDEVAG